MALPLIPPADGYNHLTWGDGTHDVKFKWQPTDRQALDYKTSLMHFDGRPWPLAFFKEYGDEKFDVSFMVDTLIDGDQWANLRALVDGAFSKTILVWTDVFGHQFNCVVTVDPVMRDFVLGGIPGQVSGRPLGGRFQTVHFTVHRVT